MDAHTDLLDKYRLDTDWTYIGSGQNGSAYRKGSTVVKVTTDEVELEHAKIVEDKKYPSLNPISNVEVHNPQLGTYHTPLLTPIPSQAKSNINKYAQKITKYIETGEEDLIEGLLPSLQKFFKQVRIDFKKAGIPLDETDIQGDNVMVDASDKLKMIDY